MALAMNEQVRHDWREILRAGLLAGLAALFVCLVGMVDTFDRKDVIGGVISQGQILLVLIWIGFGYLVHRRGLGGDSVQSLALAGAVVGAVTSAMLVILVLIAEPINLRSVLVEASPSLVDLLTFGLGPATGSAVLLILGAVVGALGAVMPELKSQVRRPLFLGLVWVLGVGIFQDVLAPILVPKLSAFLFDVSGLSIEGAVVVFVLVAGLVILWDQKGVDWRQKVDVMPAKNRKNAQWILIGLGLVLAVALPVILDSFLSDVLGTVGLYILMGLGLNIVVGYAGLLDLGYVAFFAIGAYVMAVLTSTGELGLGLNFWLAVPFSILGAVIAGVILGVPVLQMRGDYLAIVTMGFGEIIRILVLSDALRPYIGGAQGILSVPKISVLGLRLAGPVQLLYLIVLACLLAVFISRRLADSRIGRAWMAIREDEDVAEAVGIGLVKHKLMAFAAGAAFAGLSGAIFATKLGSVFPHSMKLEVSIWVLCLIIVGGMGSIPGVAVGALFMMGLPELLRTFAEYRLLFYGAILVVMMLVRPEGLWPEESRRRELHAADEDQNIQPAGPEA